MAQDSDAAALVGGDVAARDEAREIVRDDDAAAAHFAHDAVRDGGLAAAEVETVADAAQRAFGDEGPALVLDDDCRRAAHLGGVGAPLGDALHDAGRRARVDGEGRSGEEAVAQVRRGAAPADGAPGVHAGKQAARHEEGSEDGRRADRCGVGVERGPFAQPEAAVIDRLRWIVAAHAENVVASVVVKHGCVDDAAGCLCRKTQTGHGVVVKDVALDAADSARGGSMLDQGAGSILDEGISRANDMKADIVAVQRRGEMKIAITGKFFGSG